jgi:hypothetical protein
MTRDARITGELRYIIRAHHHLVMLHNVTLCPYDVTPWLYPMEFLYSNLIL